MKIDVFSDTVCPWCYIGKRRLERALAAPGAPEAEISWRPFQLNPGMPAGGMDRAEYLAWKFGGAAPARRAYGAVRDAAAAESLPLRLDAIARTPNTLASHRLIHYAAGRGAQNAAVDALFRAYFTEGADIGDIDILTGAAAAAGLSDPPRRPPAPGTGSGGGRAGLPPVAARRDCSTIPRPSRPCPGRLKPGRTPP